MFRAGLLVALAACVAVSMSHTASAVPLSGTEVPLRKYARTGKTRTALDDYVDKVGLQLCFIARTAGVHETAIDWRKCITIHCTVAHKLVCLCSFCDLTFVFTSSSYLVCSLMITMTGLC